MSTISGLDPEIIRKNWDSMRPVGQIERIDRDGSFLMRPFAVNQFGDVKGIDSGDWVVVGTDRNDPTEHCSGPRPGSAIVNCVSTGSKPFVFMHGGQWNMAIPAIAPGDYVYVIPAEKSSGIAAILHSDWLPGSILVVTDGRGLRPASRKEMYDWIGYNQIRAANELSDQCGALKSENNALLAENARLRREVERLQRRGK